MNDAFVIFIFVLLSFAYVGWVYRTTDTAEFHTDSRQVGKFRNAATIFAVFGAPHFAIFTALAISYGWWSVAFFAGVVTGLAILNILTHAIRKRHVEDDYHTFSDIAANELNVNCARCLSIVGFLFTVSVVATQLILGAEILERVGGIDYQVAVVSLVMCVCGYLYFGGYKSLLYTDVIQAILMFLLTGVFVYYIWGAGLVPGPAPATLAPSKPVLPFILFLFLTGIFAASGGPELWQRVLTAKTDSTARFSLVYASIAMFTWGCFVVGAGLTIFALEPSLQASPGSAFVEFVATRLPPWIVGMTIVMLLAALVSTADTEVFTSAIIAHKELKRAFGKPSSPLSISRTQIAILVIGAVSCGAALISRNLVNALGLIGNFAYIMGPLAFAIVLGRGGPTREWRTNIFYVSLLTSVAGFVWTYSRGAFFSWEALSILLPACVPLLIPGQRTSETTPS